jgi:hypothetical protein
MRLIANMECYADESNLKIPYFWIVILFWWVHFFQHFEGSYWIHLQVSNSRRQCDPSECLEPLVGHNSTALNNGTFNSSAVRNCNPANISTMGQSPSWRTKSLAANQEILHVLLNPEFRDRVHKSLPLVCILSQKKPIPILTCLFFNIRFRSLSGITVHLQRNAAWPKSVLPVIYDLVVHSPFFIPVTSTVDLVPIFDPENSLVE